jgi:hypothetical protein
MKVAPRGIECTEADTEAEEHVARRLGKAVVALCSDLLQRGDAGGGRSAHQCGDTPRPRDRPPAHQRGEI